MEPVYTPVVFLVKCFYKAMGYRLIIEGTEHLPRQGAAVLASNHVGYLDFTFIGYGAQPAKRLVRFAAKKEVFDHPISGPLMRGMKHIPVDRDGDVNQVMDEAHRKLEAGEMIGMFPEGTISRSFIPATAKTGTARMAMRAGAPLIPVSVWGSQRVMTKAVARNLQRRMTMMVRYGPPIDYRADDDPRDVTKRLMDTVTGMVIDQQDRYPDTPAGDDDTWWQPARLGGSAPTPDEAEEIIRQERIARRARRKALREGEAGEGEVGEGDERQAPPDAPSSAA